MRIIGFRQKSEWRPEILYNDLTAKRPKKTGYHNHGHAGETRN